MPRLVVRMDPGTVSINYTWLPTWIGLNTSLMLRATDKLRKEHLNKPLTDELLARMEGELIEFLVSEWPNIHGLRELLFATSRVKAE